MKKNRWIKKNAEWKKIAEWKKKRCRWMIHSFILQFSRTICPTIFYQQIARSQQIARK